jgi:alkaline phosphatase D
MLGLRAAGTAALALLTVLKAWALSGRDGENVAYRSPMPVSRPWMARPREHFRLLQEETTDCEFLHGVASGDPTIDGVLLWTRVTLGGTEFPEVAPLADDPANRLVSVTWDLWLDEEGTNPVKSGTTATDGSVDFIVKVEVRGLDPGLIYYYSFEACGATSALGRTRTLPSADAEVGALRLAVMSCSSYQYGYFHAYDALAKMPDEVDIVAHLGGEQFLFLFALYMSLTPPPLLPLEDYIYEYGPSHVSEEPWFWVGAVRANVMEPPKDPVTLEEYRSRYSWYRRDLALQSAHGAFPWFLVADDHEVANNAFSGGAANHNSTTQGPWEDRLEAGLRSWFEWLPVRQLEEGGVAGRIYRSFTWGDLAEVFLLDTRYDGRQSPPGDSPDIGDDRFGYMQWIARTFNNPIMSDEQMGWLTGGLRGSTRQWKVLGNQVPFTDISNPLSSGGRVGYENDMWVGYKESQASLLDALAGGVENAVFVTGDVHVTYALEAFANPNNGGLPYAVEFTTPSITSAGSAEFAMGLGTDPADIPRLVSASVAANPWMVDAEWTQKGFFVAAFTVEALRVRYYGVGNVTLPTYDLSVYRDFTVCAGTPKIYQTPDALC